MRHAQTASCYRRVRLGRGVSVAGGARPAAAPKTTVSASTGPAALVGPEEDAFAAWRFVRVWQAARRPVPCIPTVTLVLLGCAMYLHCASSLTCSARPHALHFRNTLCNNLCLNGCTRARPCWVYEDAAGSGLGAVIRAYTWRARRARAATSSRGQCSTPPGTLACARRSHNI